jgi:hypothetical protein
MQTVSAFKRLLKVMPSGLRLSFFLAVSFLSQHRLPMKLTICDITVCQSYGYTDANTVECLDTYNPSNKIFNDRSVGNAIDLQWQWMLCNEPFGYWQKRVFAKKIAKGSLLTYLQRCPSRKTKHRLSSCQLCLLATPMCSVLSNGQWLHLRKCHFSRQQHTSGKQAHTRMEAREDHSFDMDQWVSTPVDYVHL